MAILTGVELAALDLIIEMKKEGSLAAGFIDTANTFVFAVPNIVGDVMVAAQAIAAVAQGPILSPAAAAAPSATAAGGTASAGGALTLSDLIEVRRRAVAARNASKP